MNLTDKTVSSFFSRMHRNVNKYFNFIFPNCISLLPREGCPTCVFEQRSPRTAPGKFAGSRTQNFAESAKVNLRWHLHGVSLNIGFQKFKEFLDWWHETLKVSFHFSYVWQYTWRQFLVSLGRSWFLTHQISSIIVGYLNFVDQQSKISYLYIEKIE